MSNLCIIPARGGSKRIIGKNIKDFRGKPIISYSIEAAINSSLFDEVMVSTDDLEIAAIAKEYGATVPFLRSQNTASDYATTFEVIQEVVTEYEVLNKNFDFICCIYPCAPFVSCDTLTASFNLLQTHKFDSVFPIMPFGFPVQRALKIEGNQVHFFYPQFAMQRSQDLEKSFHDAGQFYWLNKAVCLQKKQLVTDNSGSIIISELEGQDIDNETDWKLAELKYEILQSIK